MYQHYKEVLIKFLENNRSLVVVFFCLPASLIFTYITLFFIYLKRIFNFEETNHLSRVKQVQNQIYKWKQLPESKRKFLVNSRPNWQSLSLKFFKKHKFHRVSVDLYEIIELNELKLSVMVEPYVTIGQITKYLVEKGYMLACTIEIKDATCGGLAMGVGMSTHSHKVGLFQESIVKYGVVLPSGEHVQVTCDNDYSDLFYALPWSHGSLAILVSLELKIIPIKPYLKIQYRPVYGLENYCDAVRRLSGALSGDCEMNIPDFVEGTVFSKTKAVIMTADFVNDDQLMNTYKSGCSFNNVNRWYKPYFFKHVESFLSKPTNSDGVAGEELIPIEDYLFRHNRSIFWVLQDIVEFCHNPIFRFLCGWMCPPKPAFLKFTTTTGIRELTVVKQVFQDIVLPMTVLEKSIELTEQLFDIYPILIYPCRFYSRERTGLLRSPRQDQMKPHADYGLFYDLGVYGVPGAVKRREYYDAAAAMRGMEQFIRQNGGYSFLYADIFMTRCEFEEMFDVVEYDLVRDKYQLDKAFHHLYDKVKPECDVLNISKRHCQSFKMVNKKEI